MSTRATRIDELNKLISDAKNELSFLNDSAVFYDLDLGTGTKSVLVIDFSQLTGNKIISSDNQRKLATEWYQNYAAYLPEHEHRFFKDFRRLRSIQKLTMIHRFLEGTDFPADLTGKDVLQSWWTIGMDNAGDENAEPQTKFIAVEKSVVAVGLTNRPSIQEPCFYFSSQANAEAAINAMIDNEKDGDKKYDDLNYLFGLIKDTDSKLN